MEQKSLPSPPFAGDTGEADPRLVSALRAAAGDAGRLPEVLAALHHVRVLTPVVAVAADRVTGAAGLLADKRADIAVPLLEGEDGRRALAVFSSVEAMAAWDPTARPVPVEGRRAAVVAVSEGAELLVIDLAGPVTCVLEEVELRALAQGRGANPAYDDAVTAQSIAARLQSQPAVNAAWLSPAVGADARLALRLSGGEGSDEVGDVLTTVAASVADEDVVRRAAVRGLEVTLATRGTARGRQVFPAGSEEFLPYAGG